MRISRQPIQANMLKSEELQLGVYQSVADTVQQAITILGESPEVKDDSFAKECIANLSVVLLDLKRRATY